MNKEIIVYTVLTGKSYDKLCQPSIISEKVDYVCFVDKGNKIKSYEGVWKLEEIDFEIEDAGRLSRYPKILPHRTIISQYKYSLYIDANIDIKDVFIYNRIFDLISNNQILALINHPYRDCPYQELYVCIAGCKGGWLDLIRQYIYLRRKKVPKHSGLFEANIIFREHNNLDVVKFGEIWWKTFLYYSKRDQLSLVTAIKESNIHYSLFLDQNSSSRNHFALELRPHLSQVPTFSQKLRFRFINLFRGLGRCLLKDYKKT